VKLRVALMLTPALGVVLVLFAGGLALAFLQSAGYFLAGGENSFTLRHYADLFTDPEFRTALLFSFWVATVSTLLSAVLGVLLAVSLRELAAYSPVFNTFLQIPLAVPHLAMAVVLLNLIAPGGMLARVAYAIGLIGAPGEFPQWTGDAYGVGIIAAYVLKETPFIALMTLAVLVRTGREYEAVARTMGASFWQRLRHVTLPMVAPGVVSASLVVYAFVFGAFEAPYVLGRPYPAMLAVVAQRKFMAMDLADQPEALALAFLMALAATGLVAAYLRLARILIGLERPAVL
jgi:putative spermidine/putrescine transport system permease protein